MSDHCGASGCGGGCDSASCGQGGGESPEDRQEKRLQEQLGRIGQTVLVMSGKGGVGKSTVATNLAVSLAMAGRRVGLLDVDFHGPSVPLLLGLERERIPTDDGFMLPVEVGELKVMSLGLLIEDPDAAVIWRGPMKMGVIRQMVADVAWGDLDYLVVDCPPGTGDEPLSVAQTFASNVGAIIVTTPQKVALADVRRSISFCRQLEMPVHGVIENMSGFACPSCGKTTDLFGSGGGEAMAREMGVSFLGRIPLDPAVMQAGDAGRSYVHHYAGTPTAAAFAQAIQPILALHKTDPAAPQSAQSAQGLRYAVPLAGGKLCMHFGHCEQFALLDVDPQTQAITNREDLTPPPHEPGVLPRWLGEKKVTHILAGGMGARAQDLFAQQGITVLVGAPADAPEALVKAHLAGSLVSGANVCDH